MHPTGLIGVPAVITDQVRALGRNVLGEFGQEVQGREDLEIPLGPGGDPVAFRVGEGPASRLLGFEDNLTGAGHFNQSREAEGAAGNILDESLDAFVISGRQENRLIDAETGVPPGAHVLNDLRFDLALGQIKSKNCFLPDEQERRHVEFRQFQENTLGRKCPAGDQGVDVGMPVQEFTVGVNPGNHTWDYVLAPQQTLCFGLNLGWFD